MIENHKQFSIRKKTLKTFQSFSASTTLFQFKVDVLNCIWPKLVDESNVISNRIQNTYSIQIPSLFTLSKQISHRSQLHSHILYLLLELTRNLDSVIQKHHNRRIHYENQKFRCLRCFASSSCFETNKCKCHSIEEKKTMHKRKKSRSIFKWRNKFSFSKQSIEIDLHLRLLFNF